MNAWASGIVRRCWLDQRDVPRELRIGFDADGVEYELVGLVFSGERVLIRHCKTPPTKAARLMIDQAYKGMR